MKTKTDIPQTMGILCLTVLCSKSKDTHASGEEFTFVLWNTLNDLQWRNAEIMKSSHPHTLQETILFRSHWFGIDIWAYKK